MINSLLKKQKYKNICLILIYTKKKQKNELDILTDIN